MAFTIATEEVERLARGLASQTREPRSAGTPRVPTRGPMTSTDAARP